MTNKLKLHIALASVLIGAIFVACNYDDSSRKFHDEDGNKAHFKKEKVSFDVFSKNKKLFSKLITDEGILTSKSANKIVSASDNSFFINTNSATYIENENGLHSYTFFINRNLENVLLENLVISLQEDGTYKSFIVTYNITQLELQNLKNGLFVDMDNKMSIEIFNDDIFLSQLSNKIVYSPCVTGTTEYWKCSNGNQHSPGNPGPPVCVADSFEYVINVEYGLCASDDGEVIGEGDTGGSNGGGGGSSDSNDSTYDGSDTDIHGNSGVSTAPTLDEEEILEETPCEKISEQLSNSNFQEKEEIIKNSFNESEETGFTETTSGTFNELTVDNGGHSLDMPITNNTIGYIHSHINSYEVPDTNGDGVPDLVIPIKMPSPADIFKFLELLYNANDNGIPLIDIYGSMYSSTGNYTIKFTGDINDIINNYSNLNSLLNSKDIKIKFKKYFNDYGNKEKAFLNFLKNEIGIEGIRIFKIKNNGTIKEKFLNENGNVESEDC